jgi:hypothetical protein
MSGNFEIQKVRRVIGAELWLVNVSRTPVAQIERSAFPHKCGEIHPYKVFSCNSQGVRTYTHDMVVFYPEDGGWDAAVKHALTYAH